MNFGKEKDCFSKNIKVQKAGVLYKQRFRGGGKWQKRCFVLKDGAYGVTRHSALSTERESRRATTYTHSPQPRARCGPGRACAGSSLQNSVSSTRYDCVGVHGEPGVAQHRILTTLSLSTICPPSPHPTRTHKKASRSGTRRRTTRTRGGRPKSRARCRSEGARCSLCSPPTRRTRCSRLR